jgi:hypothetical protein
LNLINKIKMLILILELPQIPHHHLQPVLKSEFKD